MKKTFTVTGSETCTQPECDPAFVAKIYARSADGQTLTLFPVPGATVKEDWHGKTLSLSTDAAEVAPQADKPAAIPKKKK